MKTNTKQPAGYTVEKEDEVYCLYAPSGDEVGKFDTRREAIAKMKELLKQEATDAITKKPKASDADEEEE